MSEPLECFSGNLDTGGERACRQRGHLHRADEFVEPLGGRAGRIEERVADIARAGVARPLRLTLHADVLGERPVDAAHAALKVVGVRKEVGADFFGNGRCHKNKRLASGRAGGFCLFAADVVDHVFGDGVKARPVAPL
jgi:hypothetical protein